MDVDHFTEDCVGFSNTSVDLKTPLSEDVELNQDHLQSDGNEYENIKGASNENDTTEVIPHLVISEVTSLQPDCQNKQTEVISDYENEGEKCGGQDIIKEKTVLSNDNGSSRLTHDSTGGLELSVECVVDNKNVQLADQRSIIIDGDNESENSSNEIVLQDQKSTDSIERQQVVLNKIARRGISVMPNKFLNDSMASQSDVLALSDGTETNSCNGSRRSDTISQATKKFKTDLGCSSNIDQDFNPLTSCVSTGLRKNEILTAGKEDNFDQGDSESNTESDKNMRIPLNNKMDDGNGDCRVVNTIYCTKRNSFDEDNEDISEIVTKPTKNITGNVIIEGSAEILLSATKNVFYNKVQEFNRDMSIAALTVFSEMHQQDPRTRNKGKKRQNVDMSESDQKDGALEVDVFEQGVKADNGITILEALSATGLRSIRYAKEIPGVKEVVANDLSEDAVETIKKNIKHNHVDDLISTTMSDASLLMYQRAADQRWYDAIDLDPYGCPSRFLAAAVQAVRDGGLLLVTCTDMAVLAGNSPETCYAKYGAISLRSPACHEMALRIALQCIESHANRYGRYIVPLLSFSADFYIRLMVQIYTSPVTCKKTTSKLSMVYQCVGCQTQTLQPLGQMAESNGPSQPKFNLTHGPPVNTLCYHCHHKHTMGGPIWSAPIYNTKFVENMLRIVETSDFATGKRMQGMLEVIREELPDVPLYYTVKGLCAKLHCQAIPLVDIKSAILNAGYRVSSSHAAPTAVKTNAPSKVIWDIMRCWVHMNPVSEKRLIEGSVPAAVILEPPVLIANFDIHPRARPSSSMRKLVRYQPNPERNWGPGTRAKCNNGETDKDSKRITNQNKHKNKNKNVAFIEVVTIDDDDGENITKAHG